MDSRVSGYEPPTTARLKEALHRVPPRAQAALSARLGPVEWVLLAMVVVLPVVFRWYLASQSYFFWDDIGLFYWAHNSSAGWSYAFAPAWGHLAPGYSLTYLALDRIAPMNFEAALAILVACHAVSAVLLLRILTLLFGRAWWTYAVVLAWAISAVYVGPFTWFAAGVHSITTTTATLASIHGYLCWRVTGRRAWLAWSLVAMSIGLAFYEKALLIPVYLFLMRVLLLDPAVPLRDSLRSVREEWPVWLAYAMVCAVFLVGYSLGDYERPETDVTISDVLLFLRAFWEGFLAMLFGVRVPQFGQDDWHRTVIVLTQVALIGLVAWSVSRRQSAWRAWAFLLIAVTANALMLLGRVSQFGPEAVGYTIHYYTESALLVPLAIPFAFAVPRLRARVTAIEPDTRTAAPACRYTSGGERARFQSPTTRAAAAALVALVGYVAVTWGAGNPVSNQESGPGRFSRAYFDHLRADLAAARGDAVQPSLLDHDVPEPTVSPLTNLETRARQSGVRYSLLSSVLPLFDEHVKFNQTRSLYIVRRDGHLRRTRFVSAAGWSPAAVRRIRLSRPNEARLERRRDEWCVVAEGRRARLEWSPRLHMRGRDLWLRARYRTDSVESFRLRTNAGTGWFAEGPKLPPMRSPGTAIVALRELPNGVPTNARVRFVVPPHGRLCMRSFEIGSFDPPAPSPQPGRQAK